MKFHIEAASLDMADPFSINAFLHAFRLDRVSTKKLGRYLKIKEDRSLVSFADVGDSGMLFYDGFDIEVASKRLAPSDVSLCVFA